MNPSTLTESLGLAPETMALIVTISAISALLFTAWRFIDPIITQLFMAIKTFFVRRIDIHISEPDFNKINIFLEMNKEYLHFQRSYKIVSHSGNSDRFNNDIDDGPTTVKRENRLVPGFGAVLLRHPDYPLMLFSRKKEEGKQIFEQTETISIQFITLDESRVVKFFDDISKISEPNGPFVYESNNSRNWWQCRGIPKQVFEPVGRGANEVLRSVENFMEQKPNYLKKKIQFKRGYLLHGIPGTGKTSIIAYIANKYNMHLYVLDSASITNFSELSLGIKPNSIIVIEDIDFTVAGMKRHHIDGDDNDDDDVPSKAPMSTKDAMHSFLNCLDGVVQVNATLVFATTNSLKSLDPALIRPGRMDEIIEIGKLSSDAQMKHINRFYDTVGSYNYTLPEITFAELQLACTKHMNNESELLKQLTMEKK